MRRRSQRGALIIYSIEYNYQYKQKTVFNKKKKHFYAKKNSSTVSKIFFGIRITLKSGASVKLTYLTSQR